MPNLVTQKGPTSEPEQAAGTHPTARVPPWPRPGLLSISAGTRDSPSGLWRQAQAGFGLVTRSVSPTRVGHGCGRRTTITVGGDSRGPGPDLSGQCHGTVPVT